MCQYREMTLTIMQNYPKLMIDKKIYGDIIKYYNLYANDKQAIAYCTNIAHSQSICELFNSNGISG